MVKVLALPIMGRSYGIEFICVLKKVYFYLSIKVTCHQQVLQLVPFTKNIKTQMDSYISLMPLKAPWDNDISKLY